MKKLLKVLAILIGVAVVLVVAAIIIIPTMFDPNDYKTQIVDAVKESTGRTLTIEGDLGLSVFPWLGVTAGVIELGNAPGFEAPLFARTEKVAARVKLMPLLSKQVEMDTVTVHGLQLNLEKNKDGKTNWQDLQGSETDSKSEGGEHEMAALAIGGLDVQDANLSWVDRQAGQSYKISNLSVQTGSLSAGKPIDLEVGFDVAGTAPPIAGRITLDALVKANQSSGEVTADGVQFTADLSGPQLPGGKAKVELTADVSANTQKQTAEIANLVLKALGLQASGNLSVSEYQSTPKLGGKLSVASFDLKSFMKQLGQEAIVTTDPKALTSVSFDSQIGGTAEAISLNPLTLKLDDSTLTGQATVGKAIQFALAMDAIDADRYLPPQAEGEAASPGAAAGGAGQIPAEQLRGLNVDGKLAIGKFKIMKLNISDISLVMKAKDGVINLNPIAASLYDGTYAGNIALNAQSDTPKLSVNEKLSGIQIGPLLKDLQGKDQLSGSGNVNASLTAVGATPEAMKKSLNGNAGFSFTDGAIKGVNIPGMIREAKAKLFGGSAGGSSGEKKTDFSEMSGTFKITNGLATNNDLSMKSPLLRIGGEGNAHIAQETIDYKATTTVVATTQGQGGSDLQELAGIPIPIRITGTFAEPKYGLDFEALAAAVAKSKAADLLQGGASSLIEGGVEGATDIIKGSGDLLKDGAEGTGELGKKATDLLKGGDEGGGGLLEGLLGN